MDSLPQQLEKEIEDIDQENECKYSENILIEPQNQNSFISLSSFNQKAQEQIKLIEEQKESLKIEEEQNLKDIQEIESQLRIDQRLVHENREIRKNACREISEMCSEVSGNEEEKKEFFDCVNPWVKFCIQETNAYVLPESLNCFIEFTKAFPENYSSLLKDFYDNLDRIISKGISSLNELCKTMIFLYWEDKKIFNFAFNGLIKFISNGSIRILKFIHRILIEAIEKNCLSENVAKILFEKVINIYSSNSKNSKNVEKKKIYSQMITNIFECCEDTFASVKSGMKLPQSKEIENLLKKTNKKEKRYRFYQKVESEENDNDLNKSQEVIDYNDKIDGNYNEQKIPEEVNDLTSILPNAFFEYHFQTQLQVKMEILENANIILGKIKVLKDKEYKNLIDIYKIINLSIDDSNILIHLEGIKILEHISRLLGKNINMSKLKQILESCFLKFKDKKTLVKNELFKLFDDIIIYHCMSIDLFISFSIQFCLIQIKTTPVVKQNILEYLKILLKQSNEEIRQNLKDITEQNYISFTKTLVEFIQKESVSSIKDICSDMLIIFKSKIRDVRTFNKIIQKLPSFRKSLIEQNKENSSVNKDSQYKKIIKSSKSKYSLNNSRPVSREKDTKLNSSFRQNSSFVEDKRNLKRSQSFQKSPITKKKFQSNNLKLVKINDEINKDINKKTEDKQITTIQSQKQTPPKKEKQLRKEELNQKKENVLNHISSQDKDSLEKYSKNIVRDFLIFVNKVSLGELKEDLSVHFTLIFSILEKIIIRSKELIECENNDDSHSQSFSISQNNIKFIDHLIERIIKILVLVPCISQIEGSKPLEMETFNNFLEKIKQEARRRDKFYINLFSYSIKFSQHDKGFLQKFNFKPSIVFFLNYLKQGYEETKSEEIKDVIHVFLEETSIIPEEEKKKYEIAKENNINSYQNSFTQNMDELSDKEKNEDPSNLIKNENISKIEPVESMMHENSFDEEIKLQKEEDENDLIQQQIKKTQLLIQEKTRENSQLRERIMQYELLKKTENNSALRIINSSKISLEKDKDKDINNSTIKEEDISLMVQQNKERIINCLNRGSSSDENIRKIKEQLNQTTKKLGKALERMVQPKDKKDKNNSDIQTSSLISQSKTDILINNSNQDIFPKIEKAPKNIITEKTEYDSTISQNTGNQINHINTLNEMLVINPVSSDEISFKNNINNLLKVLSSKISEDNIFDKLKQQFMEIKSNEKKYEFITLLRTSLDNPTFISKVPINLFLELYDFILNILSTEILFHSKEENIILHLQQTAEVLKKYRSLTEMFKLMVFLLKKYFPQNLNMKISDISLVMIKVITYLTKELIKSLNFQPPVNQIEILGEINNLFVITPPSTLTVATPNAKLYQNVFIVLKSLTDEIANQNKASIQEVISFLSQNKIVCDEYILYLRKISKLP